jgi:DNA-binding NarL/FixJ family response regulator
VTGACFPVRPLVMTLTLLIADDNDLFVNALEGLLEREPSIRVVARAANGEAAAQLAAELGPDVVLMDLSMPNIDGFEATLRIREKSPETAVVVLTGSDDPDDQERARSAGAAGYVTKDRILVDLVETIRSVTSGR